MESLSATRRLPAKVVLPGHGAAIVEHVALIDERLRMHQRRASKILHLLAERPLTAYEIALRMWGNVAVTQAYLTLSEVLGHLDLLIGWGQVHEHDEGEVVHFEAVSSR
jgi:hypothetical protein